MSYRSRLVRFALVAAALLLCVGGSARADILVNSGRWIPWCPAGGCLPDLAARYDVQNNQQGFDVFNVGAYDAGDFHIWVLAGSSSFAIDVPGLSAGTHRFYAVPGLGCGQQVTIIVNPGNALPETSYDNNSISFYGWCSP